MKVLLTIITFAQPLNNAGFEALQWHAIFSKIYYMYMDKLLYMLIPISK